jgi:hypothetical protein
MLRSVSHSRPTRTNRTQVMLMDRLEAEFPALSWLVIYKAVASARVDAARALPDMLAYSLALEQHARDALVLATAAQSENTEARW